MTLNRIEASKVTHYYFDDDKIYELINVLEEPDSIIFQQEYITLTLPKYISDITFEIMKLVFNKSQRTTIGDGYVYEYELGVSHNEEDTIFIIETSYSEYRAELCNLYYNENKELVLVFKQK